MPNKPRSARQFPWTKEEDALPGKVIDREVAEKLNRTLCGVRDRRKMVGIPALRHPPQSLRMDREPRDRYAWLFSRKSDRERRAILGWSSQRIHTRRRQLAAGKVRKPQPEWSIEEDRLLGTQADEVLARKLGRPVSGVRHRRWKNRTRLLLKPWRPEDDRILGTRTDRQVALLLGRSVSNVIWRRNKLGIPPKAKPRAWTADEEALLGTKPDAELARKFGRSVAAVEARRIRLGRLKPDAVFKIVKSGESSCTWTPEEDALLGSLPDEEVASRTGHSLTSVRHARTKRHILSVHRAAPGWRPEEESLLGTRPDAEIAAQLRRTLGAVRLRRIKKGIPAWPGPPPVVRGDHE